MSATVIKFSDYSKHPRPSRVYVDTSFAVHLLQFGLTKGPPTTKDAACDAFHRVLLSDRVELVASVLTYTELVHVFCCKFPGGMYELARNALSLPSTYPGERALKALARKNPSGFDAAWQTISYRVQSAEYLFSHRTITFAYPPPLLPPGNISLHIVYLASILKDAYAQLGAADALHLAISEHLKADAVVCMDTDFAAADGYLIYSH